MPVDMGHAKWHSCGMARRVSIEAALRKAIEKDGRSSVAIARAAGVAQSQVTRFLNNERSLTLPSAEKVARALGLDLSLTERTGAKDE
jgi:plasmid maintenance system antidote protein VapI